MDKELVQLQNCIAGFKAGNKLVFLLIKLCFYHKIFAFANSLVSDSSRAKQIADDSFVKLDKLRERFDTIQNIKAFLYVTTRNDCLNYLRYIRMESKNKK